MVSPGPTYTELFSQGKTEAQKERFGQMAALGRLGQPQDIADVVALLAGEDSRWITGQNIRRATTPKISLSSTPSFTWASMSKNERRDSEYKKKHSNPRWEPENLSDKSLSIYPMKPILPYAFLSTISL